MCHDGTVGSYSVMIGGQLLEVQDVAGNMPNARERSMSNDVQQILGQKIPENTTLNNRCALLALSKYLTSESSFSYDGQILEAKQTLCFFVWRDYRQNFPRK